MEYVLFERDGLQVCLHSTVSPLSGDRTSFTVARECLAQHHGRSDTSHLWLESLHASSASCSVN